MTRKPIVKLKTKTCTRGCGARVERVGPCVACMTLRELLAHRRAKR